MADHHPTAAAQPINTMPAALLPHKSNVMETAGLEALNTMPVSPTGSMKAVGGKTSQLSSTGSLSPTARVAVIPFEPYSSSSEESAEPETATTAVAVPEITTDIEAPANTQPQLQLQPQLQTKPTRTLQWKLINYCIIPLALPVIAAWWLLALLLAAVATFSIWPSLLLAQRLYWACPFIPYIFKTMRAKYGILGSWMVRLQFEGAHCMAVLGRLFSLPLRPHLPSFYILGFPKCGTTSLASYLRAHPGIFGLSGMPGNEIFSKESHFFGGMLGRHTTTSTLLYRSFFPTLLHRWWSEAVLGVQQWMCFDACPTYACLPHVAARAKSITPNAKLVVMVRDPAAGVFSAETMLRNMGVPLDWTLAEPLKEGLTATGEPADPRFQFPLESYTFWQQLESLKPEEPLPEDLPQRFYTELHSHLMAGRFADRLAPWAREFGRESILLVDYKQFVADPEGAVMKVLNFLGADTAMYKFTPQPARVVGDYRGARMDAALAEWLNKTWFADSNAAIASMLAAGKPGSVTWP